MHERYLGDSFDIVKRFWAERLSRIAPLFAHPRFIPPRIRPAFHKMVAMDILDENARPQEPFGLFLDPHTGIPLPQAAVRQATASYAPLSFIEAELRRLDPRYLICFDQSHDRSCGLERREQRDAKRGFLKRHEISTFYYVSHAPFLFASKDAEILESVRLCLTESGIPASRLEAHEPATR
jgi:hypothetical protein